MLKTMEWTGSALRLLDQTRLPRQTVYLDICDEKQMHDAIRRLVVRGAPAIGVAAAFGVYLGVRSAPSRLDEVCDFLATARPTAVNLFWAIERVRKVGKASGPPAILAECQRMLAEDVAACRQIGQHGYQLLRGITSRGRFQILTHCNAGSLATVQYGTALAPIYVGIENGATFHVWADETRPLLQGSRITAYELQQNGVPVTVICDNMAATIMSQGRVDAVLVGADRIASNGDTANKIGTLGVAILARHFGVPVFVAAPLSTVDFAIASGAAIPIEERSQEEIHSGFGTQTAPAGVECYNPAFDVTPAALISAIITERGVVHAPFGPGLAQVAGR